MLKGELRETVRKLLKTKLTDEELMGFELGSAGTGGILAELIYWISGLLSKQLKLQKDMESAIRKYNAKMNDDKNIVLYLRQMDY